MFAFGVKKIKQHLKNQNQSDIILCSEQLFRDFDMIYKFKNFFCEQVQNAGEH